MSRCRSSPCSIIPRRRLDPKIIATSSTASQRSQVSIALAAKQPASRVPPPPVMGWRWQARCRWLGVRGPQAHMDEQEMIETQYGMFTVSQATPDDLDAALAIDKSA